MPLHVTPRPGSSIAILIGGESVVIDFSKPLNCPMRATINAPDAVKIEVDRGPTSRSRIDNRTKGAR